jgi:hypothetical protein
MKEHEPRRNSEIDIKALLNWERALRFDTTINNKSRSIIQEERDRLCAYSREIEIVNGFITNLSDTGFRKLYKSTFMRNEKRDK